jgi:hypothetical protein
VTGDVFPITRNVLKLTEIEMRQERTMKTCKQKETMKTMWKTIKRVFYVENKRKLKNTF